MKNADFLKLHGVNVANSLDLFGDMQTYNETLGDFLNDIDQKLEQLKETKEIADMANYAIYVHSLKSDAKYFGFTKLAELTYQHELESKANHIYYIYDHYDELMEELNRIIRVVQEYLGKNVTAVESHEETNVSDETILVVDDSNVIRNFVKKLFDSRFHVLVAHDGAEAIHMLESDESHNIMAMLLDLNMPNVNGFEVLKYLQGHGDFDRIFVSIITGVGDDSLINQTKEYPIQAILRKPFNEKSVKYVIDQAIDYKKQHN